MPSSLRSNPDVRCGVPRRGAVARAPLLLGAVLILALGSAACGRRQACVRCETLVIAAIGEPAALLPPLVGETVGRDVSDLIFERLAELPGGVSLLDSSAYRPRLAVRWERVDSVTLRFHLRPEARWHDGKPLTAGDVAFSFAAYADSALDAGPRQILAGRVSAAAEDDSTVLIRFREPDAEQWYDATWHVRVLPRHIWDSIPRSRWGADTAVARLVGSGPFHLTEWIKGRSLTLERAPGQPSASIRRVLWRFAGQPDATLNLLLSHEADLLEAVGDTTRIARVVADPLLQTISYPSALYVFLGFNLGDPSSPAQSRELRRALAMGIDRSTAARAAMGPGSVAPRGPLSRVLWINDDSIAVAPYDTAAAGRILDAAGWTRGRDGRRIRAGKALSIDILVPATSSSRRNLAQIVQEMWRRLGVTASVNSVDFPVFQQRLRTGKFQSFIGAWLDDPSPRSLGNQWTSAGIGNLNYVHYRSAAFDSLFRRASRTRGSPAEARQAWREALDTLNADVPGIWLATPTNTAGASKRIEGITIDPYSWLATLLTWRLREAEQ